MLEIVIALIGGLAIVGLSILGMTYIQKNANLQRKTSTPKPPSKQALEPVVHNARTHLTTKNEQKMYFALQKALPSNCIVHCQVSLMALVTPVDSKNNSRTWAKRMDFVITDTAAKVLAVIELDDFSHNNPKRKASDQYKNEALAGHHPLIRFNTQKFYDPAEIAKIIERNTQIKCAINDKSNN